MISRAETVRAILAGTKTQTRRVASPKRSIEPMTDECPYGLEGSRLWVREAWRTLDELDGHSGSRIAEMCQDAGYRRPWAPIQYEADNHRRNWQHVGTPPHTEPPKPGRYRHARFMPRWASRITLEITAVRVERLQDISEADAISEGIERQGDDWRNYGNPFDCCLRPRTSYATLWAAIHGRGSWDANPWVWVIQFKPVA